MLNKDGISSCYPKSWPKILFAYFSKQQAKGGTEKNPTLETFNRDFLSLNVAGDELFRVVNGNTRGRQREIVQLDVQDIWRLSTKKTA